MYWLWHVCWWETRIQQQIQSSYTSHHGLCQRKQLPFQLFETHHWHSPLHWRVRRIDTERQYQVRLSIAKPKPSQSSCMWCEWEYWCDWPTAWHGSYCVLYWKIEGTTQATKTLVSSNKILSQLKINSHTCLVQGFRKPQLNQLHDNGVVARNGHFPKQMVWPIISNRFSLLSQNFYCHSAASGLLYRVFFEASIYIKKPSSCWLHLFWSQAKKGLAQRTVSRPAAYWAGSPRPNNS